MRYLAIVALMCGTVQAGETAVRTAVPTPATVQQYAPQATLQTRVRTVYDQQQVEKTVQVPYTEMETRTIEVPVTKYREETRTETVCVPRQVTEQVCVECQPQTRVATVDVCGSPATAAIDDHHHPSRREARRLRKYEKTRDKNISRRAAVYHETTETSLGQSAY